jgi:hypothetical protein
MLSHKKFIAKKLKNKRKKIRRASQNRCKKYRAKLEISSVYPIKLIDNFGKYFRSNYD